MSKDAQYVNNEYLRKLLFSLYPDKVKNDVIFVIKTALCYIAKKYGLLSTVLPVSIYDFIKISSWSIFAQKAASPILFLSSIGILWIYKIANVSLYCIS